jgi:DNA-binding transcriptional regulator YiaG
MSGSELDSVLAVARANHQLPSPDERRRIRESAGISQRELAKALGVATMSIHRWEYGARPSNALIQGYVNLLLRLDAITKNGDT